MLLATTTPVVSQLSPCLELQASTEVQVPSEFRLLQPLERLSSRTTRLVSACETVLFHTAELSEPWTLMAVPAPSTMLEAMVLWEETSSMMPRGTLMRWLPMMSELMTPSSNQMAAVCTLSLLFGSEASLPEFESSTVLKA